MKKQTIKLATIAMLLAAVTKHNVHAQASVDWKQQFNYHTLHEIGVEHKENYITSTLDTLGQKLYYLSTLAEPENVDYDPTPGKFMLNGAIIGSNIYSYYDANGTYLYNEEIGTPVISAYHTSTGKHSWSAPISVAHNTSNSYIKVNEILSAGKHPGLFISSAFRGKVQYKNKTFVSVATGAKKINTDLLYLKLASDGTYQKHFQVTTVAANASMGSLEPIKMTTDQYGSLIAILGCNTNSTAATTYQLRAGNVTKQLSLRANDKAIIKMDANLNYVSHTIIQSNGNNIVVSDIKTDVFKNVLLAMEIFRPSGNTKHVDLDPGIGMNNLGVTVPQDEYRTFLVKYNPSFSATSIKKNIGVQLPKLFTDKLSNIYVATVIGDINSPEFQNEYKEITLNANTKLTLPYDSVTQLLVKYDKMGNYSSHLATTKYGSTYGSEASYYMDGNNIYFCYELSEISTITQAAYTRLFISKIKLGTTLKEVWKNSIMSSGTSYFATSGSIFAQGKNVYTTALLFSHNQDYKILVSNPLQKVKVPGSDESNSIMIKYTLSGSALSPEDETEENNVMAYKTGLEDNTIKVAVYPNPVKEDVTIKVENTENTTATIYNYSGVAVKSITLTEAETKVNTAELPAGMYFVEVVSGSEREMKKIVKQ